MFLDLVTCEYPPDIGGVADYTRQVAAGLSQRGHTVCVWTRKPQGRDIRDASDPVQISDSLGRFGAVDIWRTQNLWNCGRRRREILLQWSPTGYGARGMNLLFALWIALRVVQGDTLRVMFHEAFYQWSEPKLRHKMASIVQRLMSAVLLNSATEVFVSTEYLATRMSRLKIVGRVSIRHLPVPSNVIPLNREAAALCANTGSAEPSIRVGHFGTYNPHVLHILVPTLEKLLKRRSNVIIALIGTGSETYRDSIAPEFLHRVTATGLCSHEKVSTAIASCHIMFQPYPEGVTSRRSTAMAALAHGRLLVSTSGAMTEEFWKHGNAVKLCLSVNPDEMAEELGNIVALLTREELMALGSEARTLYERRFSIHHVLATLSTCYPAA